MKRAEPESEPISSPKHRFTEKPKHGCNRSTAYSLSAPFQCGQGHQCEFGIRRKVERWSGRVRRMPLQREKPDGNHEPSMTGAKCHNSKWPFHWRGWPRHPSRLMRGILTCVKPAQAGIHPGRQMSLTRVRTRTPRAFAMRRKAINETCSSPLSTLPR